MNIFRANLNIKSLSRFSQETQFLNLATPTFAYESRWTRIPRIVISTDRAVPCYIYRTAEWRRSSMTSTMFHGSVGRIPCVLRSEWLTYWRETSRPPAVECRRADRAGDWCGWFFLGREEKKKQSGKVEEVKRKEMVKIERRRDSSWIEISTFLKLFLISRSKISNLERAFIPNLYV